MECEVYRNGEQPCNKTAEWWVFDNKIIGHRELALCAEHLGVHIVQDLAGDIQYIVPVQDKSHTTQEDE